MLICIRMKKIIFIIVLAVVFGFSSAAFAMSLDPSQGGLEAGCNGSNKYSYMTGQKCSVYNFEVTTTKPSIDAGCDGTTVYSKTTGMKCAVYTTVPSGDYASDAGCMWGTAYSKTTGKKCANYVESTKPVVIGEAPKTILPVKFTGESSLSVGMSNADVTTLQEALRAKGFFQEESTGYFGTLTEAAVRAFQKAKGIEVTGIAGPITKGKIISDFGGEIYSKPGDNFDNEELNLVCNGINPFLALVSPRSGEEFTAGETVNFKWRACNMPSDGVAVIALRNTDSGSNTYLDSMMNIYNKTASLQIPLDMEPETYQVRIFCTKPNSDAYCTSIGSEDFSGLIEIN
jgi:hypothetical protein